MSMTGSRGCCSGGRRRPRPTTDSITRGLRGLAMATARLQLPNNEVLAFRRHQCFGDSDKGAPCDRLAMGALCKECGCLAAAKIRVASEACPLGKWPAVPSVGSRRGGHGQEVATRPVCPPEF